MRRDDVQRALDAMAAEQPQPSADAAAVVARGRRRKAQRRLTLVGVAAVLVGAIAIAATVVGTQHDSTRLITPGPTLSTPTTAHSAPGANPSTGSVFPSATEAWMCGSPLHYTDDGGRTWRDVALPAAVPPSADCTAVPGGNAWATWPNADGTDWHILRIRNVDEMQIFSLPKLPNGDVLDAPFFIDDHHGWLTSRSENGNPTLYRTTDGGGTWTRRGSDDQPLGPMAFANASAGWSASGASLFATGDGGATWINVAIPAPPVPPGSSLAYFGVVSRGASVIVWGGVHVTGTRYRTFFDVSNDHGKTWALRAGPAGFEIPDPGINNLFSATDGTNWQLVSGAELRVTSDGGRTWQERPDLPLAKNINLQFPLAFPTVDTGWATTEAGATWRTTDGGRTWTDVTNGGEPRGLTTTTTTPKAPVPAQAVPIPIAVASDREAWLCSSQMLYTNDAGVNWRSANVKTYPPSAPSFQQPLCAATAGGDGWMLTSSEIPYEPQIVHLRRGGEAQDDPARIAHLGPNATIVDLTFVDAEHGWALSAEHEGNFTRNLYATSDGGKTWSLIGRDVLVNGSIHFTSTTDGWAAGSNTATAEVLHTTDGGRTWQTVEVPAPQPVTQLGAAVGNIAVTHDAIIAAGSNPTGNLTGLFFDVSTDGGRTWTMRSGPTNRTFGTTESMAFNALDADHWQLSGQSWLWTTPDGGRTWTQVAELAAIDPITEVGFLTAEAGLVSGRGAGPDYNASVVLQTNDGGSTWTTADAHAPPSSNARVSTIPGGVIGCPTQPVTPTPAGNAGLVEAAIVYAGSNSYTVTNVYRVGASTPGEFNSVFTYNVGSCPEATVKDSWVVEMHGPVGQGGGGSTDQTQLALAHYADGWHVFGRYH